MPLNYCPKCGAIINQYSSHCDNCGIQLKINFFPVTRKKPLTAAIFSFFLPGLGQFYNGNTIKGMFVFLGVLFTYSLFIPALFIWIYGVYDAYSTANKMNDGIVPYRQKSIFFPLALIFGGIFVFFIIVAFIIGFMSTTPQLSNIPNSDNQIVGVQGSISKTNTLPYILRGRKGHVTVMVYDRVYNELNSREPIFYEGERDQAFQTVFYNQLQDDNFKELFDKITKLTNSTDDQVRIVVSIVQNMNYITGYDDYSAQYPYETLYTGSGDCSQKSILLAYLLKNLGYDTVLFIFETERHMAVGIKTTDSYDFMNTGYAFIETTTPSIITDSQGFFEFGFLTSSPTIIPVSKGKSFQNLQEEYNDAKTLQRLEKMGSILSEYNYKQWESLIQKYGIPIRES